MYENVVTKNDDIVIYYNHDASQIIIWERKFQLHK